MDMNNMTAQVSLVGFDEDVSAGIEQLGDGEDVFVVLPGGPGLPAQTMRFEAELLAEFGTVLLLDPPGVGQSSPPPLGFDYSPTAHAEWYLAALTSLGVPQFKVLGASFGGMAAIAMAAQAPERVMAGICVSTRVIGVDLDDEESQSHMAQMLGRHASSPWYAEAMETFDSWQELVANAENTAEIKEMNRKILPLYAAHPDAPEVWEKIQQLAQVCDFDVPATKAWEDGLYQSFDLRPALQKITSKFLVLGGDSDWMTSPAGHQRIATEIPQAKVLVVPDCGHLVALERPDVFKAAVVEFFGGSESRLEQVDEASQIVTRRN